MTAFLLVEAKLTDTKRFAAYVEKVPKIVEKYGGEYLVKGGDMEVLEGDWDGMKIVIHRWSNKHAAKKFWNSTEYREARQIRVGTGEFRVMLLEGFNSERLE